MYMCIKFSGSLHLGNIFLNKDQVVLSGLPNFIGGLSGKMKEMAIKVKVTIKAKAYLNKLIRRRYHNSAS